MWTLVHCDQRRWRGHACVVCSDWERKDAIPVEQISVRTHHNLAAASDHKDMLTRIRQYLSPNAHTRCRRSHSTVYHTHFLQISNPSGLRPSQQLSDEERNAEFFNGFHPRDRDIIYDKLFILNPRRPIRRAPDFDETWEAARG